MERLPGDKKAYAKALRQEHDMSRRITSGQCGQGLVSSGTGQKVTWTSEAMGRILVFISRTEVAAEGTWSDLLL